jgi:hypothetical protein
VDWTRTPEDVLNSLNKDEPLVWVGLVEEVLVSQKGSQVEILWICKHLRFAEPGLAAISRRPIKVKEGAGSFAVSLVVDGMSLEEARQFQREHTTSPHYLVAGGTFQSFVENHGQKVPFLKTIRMGLGPKLAAFR